MKSDDLHAFIDPHRLYTRRGFLAASGLGDNTVRTGRRKGIELLTLTVGRQRYVRGSDGIAWIERLAAANGDLRP